MKPITTRAGLAAWLLACGVLLTACGGDGGGNLTAQTISFTKPGSQTLATTSVTLAATASSGLAVSFASNSSSVCTVSGSTVTLVAAGDCSVVASQAGDATYAAATSVTNVFAVNRASQTITFTSPGNQTLGTTPAPLVATASSGLAVSLASTTPTICTVTDTTLTLVAAGKCTITASQAGNSRFMAANAVSYDLIVAEAGAPVPATLTFSSGFQAGSTTIEGGNYGGYAGSDPTSACTNCFGGSGQFSPDVSAAASNFHFDYNPSVAPVWAYIGIYMMAPGLSGFSSSGDTGGVQVVDQTSINFTLGENTEWYSSGNPNITVVLVLGHLEAAGCNVNLTATLAPTAAASTAYSLPLSSFSVNQGACATSSTAAEALAAYPISQIQFQGAGNAGGSAVPNTTTSLYPTELSLTGGVTFQ